MTEYTPDKWLVVKIEGKEYPLTYKVFACWHGGYLDGDSWKLNSGITKVTKKDNFYLFKGLSSSVYSCNEKRYGSTMYGYGVLHDIIEKSKQAGVNIEKMPEETNWLDLSFE